MLVNEISRTLKRISIERQLLTRRFRSASNPVSLLEENERITNSYVEIYRNIATEYFIHQKKHSERSKNILRSSISDCLQFFRFVPTEGQPIVQNLLLPKSSYIDAWAIFNPGAVNIKNLQNYIAKKNSDGMQEIARLIFILALFSSQGARLNMLSQECPMPHDTLDIAFSHNEAFYAYEEKGPALPKYTARDHKILIKLYALVQKLTTYLRFQNKKRLGEKENDLSVTDVYRSALAISIIPNVPLDWIRTIFTQVIEFSKMLHGNQVATLIKCYWEIGQIQEMNSHFIELFYALSINSKLSNEMYLMKVNELMLILKMAKHARGYFIRKQKGCFHGDLIVKLFTQLSQFKLKGEDLYFLFSSAIDADAHQILVNRLNVQTVITSFLGDSEALEALSKEDALAIFSRMCSHDHEIFSPSCKLISICLQKIAEHHVNTSESIFVVATLLLHLRFKNLWEYLPRYLSRVSCSDLTLLQIEIIQRIQLTYTLWRSKLSAEVREMVEKLLRSPSYC